jgi:hypothetical protein
MELMPTATKSPPRPLTELEQAEAAVVAAAQRAEAAREKAEAARQAAQLRQAERQRQWADCEVAANVDRITHHAQVVGAARTTFEAAVVSDPSAAATAFLTWVDAMAQRHACESSFDMARGIIGQPAARLTAWPEPSFTTEVDGILQARSYELLEEATEVEKARRVAAFNGQETS